MKNEQYRLVLLFVVIPQEKCNLYFMIFHFSLFTYFYFHLVSWLLSKRRTPSILCSTAFEEEDI